MNDHITELLGAYHDGELQGRRLRQVTEHLEECEACTAELDSIRSLSTLLQETVPAEAFLPTERIVANLALNLPRRPEISQPRSIRQIGWWLVPVGLLAAWVFIDITNTLSSVVSIAANSGIFGSRLAWMQGGMPLMTWFGATMNLFGDQVGGLGGAFLTELNELNLFFAKLAGRLIPYLVIVTAYLGWLLTWWLGQQETPAGRARN